MKVCEFVRSDLDRNNPIVIVAPAAQQHFFYWNTFDLVSCMSWQRIKDREIKEVRASWIIRTLVIKGGPFLDFADE